jgi:hypothetical protein
MDYHSYKNNQIALGSTVGDDGSPQHEIWAYCMEWLLFRAARSQKNGNVTEVGTSEVIMGRATRREYQKNPREFDGWVKANTLLGSILAIGMVAMALAGLNSAGPPDAATEFSSVTASK